MPTRDLTVIRVAALTTALATSACGGPIFTGNGIPYHEVEQYDVVTTTRRSEWVEFRLEMKYVAADDKPHAMAESFFIVRGGRGDQCARDAQEAFASGGDALDSIAAFRNAMRSEACAGVGPLSPKPLSPDDAAKLDVVGIKTERRQRPSMSRSYINVQGSGAGTAAATIKLAPNGTMTEATGSVEDKRAELIATTATGLVNAALPLFPINALLTKKWDLQPADTETLKGMGIMDRDPAAKRPKELVATLAIAVRARLYVTSVHNGNVIDHVVVEGSAPEAPKDGGAIQFSGSVKLPTGDSK